MKINDKFKTSSQEITSTVSQLNLFFTKSVELHHQMQAHSFVRVSVFFLSFFLFGGFLGI